MNKFYNSNYGIDIIIKLIYYRFENRKDFSKNNNKRKNKTGKNFTAHLIF